jgi:hypothetical protein
MRILILGMTAPTRRHPSPRGTALQTPPLELPCGLILVWSIFQNPWKWPYQSVKSPYHGQHTACDPCRPISGIEH